MNVLQVCARVALAVFLFALATEGNGASRFRTIPLGDEDFIVVPTRFSVQGAIVGAPDAVRGVLIHVGANALVLGAGSTFQFDELSPGSFVVSPSKAGCTFDPISTQVKLGPDALGLSFSASCAFQISGNVGSAGVTVSAGGMSSTSASDGTFTISGVPPGTVNVIPAKAGCYFSPSSISLQLDQNKSGVAFSPTCTHLLSGNVGIGGANVVANSRQTSSSPGGGYQFAALPEGNIVVTPSKANCTFSPPNRNVALLADVTGVNFGANCTYSVGGNVGRPGVVVNVGPYQATSDASGAFVVNGVPPGGYSITPAKPNCSFSPASRNVSIVDANIAGQNFAIECGYLIGGNAGISGALVSIGSASVTSDGTNSYRFTDLAAGTYIVTPSKAGCYFTPATRTAVVGAGQNQLAQNFTAACPPTPVYSRTKAVTLPTSLLTNIRRLDGVNGTVLVYEVDTSKIGEVQANSSDPYWWQYYRLFWNSAGAFQGLRNTGAPAINSGFCDTWTTQKWATVDQFGNPLSNAGFGVSAQFFDTRSYYLPRVAGSTSSCPVQGPLSLFHHSRNLIRNNGTSNPVDILPGHNADGSVTYFSRSTPLQPVTYNFSLQLYNRTTLDAATSSYEWEKVVAGEVHPSGWAIVPLDPYLTNQGKGVQWVFVKPMNKPWPKLRRDYLSNCPIPGAVGENPINGANPCIIDPVLPLEINGNVTIANGVCRDAAGVYMPAIPDSLCARLPSGTFSPAEMEFILASAQFAYGGVLTDPLSQPDYLKDGKLYAVLPSPGSTDVNWAEIDDVKQAILSVKQNNAIIFMNGSLNSVEAARANAKAIADKTNRPVVLVYMAQSLAYSIAQGTNNQSAINSLSGLLLATAGDPGYPGRVQVVGHSWSGHIALNLTKDYSKVDVTLVNPAHMPLGEIKNTYLYDLQTTNASVVVLGAGADWVSQSGYGLPVYDTQNVCMQNCPILTAIAANAANARIVEIGERTRYNFFEHYWEQPANGIGHGLLETIEGTDGSGRPGWCELTRGDGIGC